MKREKVDKFRIRHKEGKVKITAKHTTVSFPEIKLSGYGYVVCETCDKVFRKPCILWGTANCFNKKTPFEMEQEMTKDFEEWKVQKHKCKKCENE